MKNLTLFRRLKFSPTHYGGTIAKTWFPNNYGASVVCSVFAESNGLDTYELAVLRLSDKGRPFLCYTTAITDDVLGGLTASEVDDLLLKIAAFDAVKLLKS